MILIYVQQPPSPPNTPLTLEKGQSVTSLVYLSFRYLYQHTCNHTSFTIDQILGLGMRVCERRRPSPPSTGKTASPRPTGLTSCHHGISPRPHELPQCSRRLTTRPHALPQCSRRLTTRPHDLPQCRRHHTYQVASYHHCLPIPVLDG